jgi:UDP-glucose 4-epimerase
MLNWIARGRPMPLGRITNQRSYVSGWNLADLVATSLVHPAAAGHTWLVSDGAPVSTPDLLRLLARSLNRVPRLFAVSEQCLRLVATLAGREQDQARLCGSLVVDDRATRSTLGWAPPVPFDEGLRRTAVWYLESVADVNR